MKTLAEALVESYFINKGFKVSKTYPSKNKFYNVEKGTPDFLLTSKNGKIIYLEVKRERDPIFLKHQMEFMKKAILNGEIYWVMVVSSLGSFILFEIKKDLSLVILNKGFFELSKQNFYFYNNKIKLYDLRYMDEIKLKEHIDKLEKIRSRRKNLT